jgi:hypothetical protein
LAAGVVFETGFAGAVGLVNLGAGFVAVAFLAAGEGAAFGRGFLETGFLERVLATCVAGSGCLTAAFGAVLAGLVNLGAGFVAVAFLAAGDDFTGFPEGFRDGEDLEFFFNVEQLVPMSLGARKDRLS